MTRLESFYILDLARPISHEGTRVSKRGTWSTVDHILADPQGTTASAIESAYGYRDFGVWSVTCEETPWSSSCGCAPAKTDMNKNDLRRIRVSEIQATNTAFPWLERRDLRA